MWYQTPPSVPTYTCAEHDGVYHELRVGGAEDTQDGRHSRRHHRTGTTEDDTTGAGHAGHPARDHARDGAHDVDNRKQQGALLVRDAQTFRLQEQVHERSVQSYTEQDRIRLYINGEYRPTHNKTEYVST